MTLKFNWVFDVMADRAIHTYVWQIEQGGTQHHRGIFKLAFSIQGPGPLFAGSYTHTYLSFMLQIENEPYRQHMYWVTEPRKHFSYRINLFWFGFPVIPTLWRIYIRPAKIKSWISIFIIIRCLVTASLHCVLPSVSLALVLKVQLFVIFLVFTTGPPQYSERNRQIDVLNYPYD